MTLTLYVQNVCLIILKTIQMIVNFAVIFVFTVQIRITVFNVKMASKSIKAVIARATLGGLSITHTLKSQVA